jgi:hypothetical protein
MAMLAGAAPQSAHLGAFVACLAFGVVLAVAGHLWRSRMLVVTGLLVIAAVFVYFSFVLKPS